MGFGLTADAAAVIIDIMEALRERYDGRSYLAFLDGRANPVAFSLMEDLARIAHRLSGHVRDPGDASRPRVYTSVVLRRVADARAGDAAAVVIQACRDTSAPICQKLGFREVCALDIYAPLPAGA